jgi:hypothetical protein
LVEEAAAIKKIITDQNKKVELPGGIEPNTEEAKDMEREKLSELIAKKLGEVMKDLGIGSGAGLGIPGLPIPGVPTPGVPTPDGPDKNKDKPTPDGPDKNKDKPTPKKDPSKLKSRLKLGGKLLGAAGLAYGAYEASEFLEETGYGDTMNQGAGKDAEKAFRENVAPTIDPVKAGISKEEARAALENGSPRDIEKLGGEAALRNIVGVELAKPFEQASLRKYDYIPETSPKIPAVEPKPTETNVGKMLNEVSDKNTELKMFNMEENAATQMLAPIISNRTINNTEQTMITNSPSPHSNSNSFNRWQSYRSGYTDSIK